MERLNTRFPVWLRRPFSVTGRWEATSEVIRSLGLQTICESARCPNLGECWSHGNVSFMILGGICTRRCAFCAVTTGRPGEVDSDEPQRLSEAVTRLGLQYVVVTAPARDDLDDEGAWQFAATIRTLKARVPSIGVEVLTPDFHGRGELIEKVVEAGPDVFSHNLETVRRLSPTVRPQARYDRSLAVLRCAQRLGAGRVKVKSGFMVGLGEQPQEVWTLMEDLRGAGCQLLTIGQYLQPTLAQRPVTESVPLERYAEYRQWGMDLGFEHVASGPYVRSSYNAYEALQVTSDKLRQNGGGRVRSLEPSSGGSKPA